MNDLEPTEGANLLAIRNALGLTANAVQTIRVINGSVQSSLAALRTNFPGLTSFIDVTTSADITLPEFCFSALFALERVEIARATIVGDSCFAFSTALREVELRSVTQLTGDGHFMSCAALTAVYLEALTSVDSSAADIFLGCVLLGAIGLGPNPPNAFHPQVFANRAAIDDSTVPPTLRVYVASPETAQTYDNSTLISGDVAGDGYWCGLALSQFALRPTPKESPTASVSGSPRLSPQESLPPATASRSPMESPWESLEATVSSEPASTEPPKRSVLTTVLSVIVCIVLVIGVCISCAIHRLNKENGRGGAPDETPEEREISA
jgi:hypothetical protein